MRILMVTMQLGPGYSQGTERYVDTLTAHLRDRGHTVTQLAGDPLGHFPPATLGQPRPGREGLYAYPTCGWMSLLGQDPQRLADWLKDHRPDLVHLNTPAHIGAGVIDACRQLGMPCVVTVHDYWWVCPKGTLLTDRGTVCDATPPWRACLACMAGSHERAWVRALALGPGLRGTLLPLLYFARAAARGMPRTEMTRWFRRREVLLDRLRAASHVIFPSKSIATVLEPSLGQTPSTVIPNGLDASWFAPPRSRPPTCRPPHDLVIGFGGALEPHKAPHLLLEALHQLGWTKTQIRIAGAVRDHAYEQRLHDLARGLNVSFLGRLEPQAMPTFLADLDIFAITSIWPENYPYAVLEAHAAGATVVGSDLGGMTEQIVDAPLRFRPNDADDLARALEHARCHRQPTDPRIIPTAGAMCDQVEAIYQRIAPSA